jgi:peptidoglycan/xylan/chitin deacetylase (PgdA/CDA1 family)
MRRPLIVCAGAAAAAWYLPALAPVAQPVARGLRVARRLADTRAVAITFDDGPHPEGTPAALEALAAAGATATFFLVGEQVERHPSLAADIAAAGHGIASHGYRHRNQLRRPPRELSDDLRRAHAVIAEAAGRAPAVYRPPYGIFSWPGLALVREAWTPLLWSRWGRDWAAGATPGSIAALVTDGLVGGDVLLLHDADTYSVPGSHRRTAAALPRILELVRARRLEPVAL